MNKIIKGIINALFVSKEERENLISELKQNPNFRTPEEIERNGYDSKPIDSYKLKGGEVQTIISRFGKPKRTDFTQMEFCNR